MAIELVTYPDTITSITNYTVVFKIVAGFFPFFAIDYVTIQSEQIKSEDEECTPVLIPNAPTMIICKNVVERCYYHNENKGVLVLPFQTYTQEITSTMEEKIDKCPNITVVIGHNEFFMEDSITLKYTKQGNVFKIIR